MSPCPSPHNDLELLGAAEVGTVARLADGVITVSIGYITLRLERPAFEELHSLLDAARRRLDLGLAEEVAARRAGGRIGLPPLH